jgi:hypothetical protein
VHRVQNPSPNEHGDIFRYTTDELRSVANPYATNNEAVTLLPTQGSKEVTLSSSKEAPSGVAIHSTKDGIKGGKKRHKQHPQGAMTMTNHNDGNYGKVGGSDAERIVTTAHSVEHQARPPTDHFRRLLEGACPNHAYPIRHKLKDCDMMKSFMIFGSFTRGMELNEDLCRSDTMPFPGEDTVMTVYGGHFPLERCRVSKLSHGPPTHCSWGRRGTWV